jgi:hypothetical protein
MAFPKPCIECGVLTSGGTRCDKHQTIIDAKVNQRKAQRVHYKRGYQVRAKLVRQNATHCWICGDGPRAYDPFQADHVQAGNPESELLPAHRSCNAKRGNKQILNP